MIPSMSELPVNSPTLFLLNSFALSLLQHVDQSQQQQQQQHVDQVSLWSNYRKVQIWLDACESLSMIFLNCKAVLYILAFHFKLQKNENQVE